MSNLMKIDPFIPMKSFFNDFFNNDISNFMGSDNIVTLPSVNIIENDANFELEVAAPGMSKKDIELNVVDGYLIIKGKKEEKTEEQDEKYTRREFNYSAFERRFNLPDSVKEDNISAKFENGILKVTIEKKEEKKKQPPKTIKIS